MSWRRRCARGVPKSSAAALVMLLVSTSGGAKAQPAAPEQHSENAAESEPEGDETLFELSAGGLLNTGNTESWLLSTGSRFRLVRGPHAFGLEGSFNYGQANLPADMDESFEDVVKNFHGRARYDFFFTDMDAVFVAFVYRWDTFAGLDARAQGQVGYLRNLFRREAHRLWVEIGYDLTYDDFHPDPLLDDMGNVLDGSQIVHSARGFVGYDNRINEAITYTTGLEVLVNVQDPGDVRVGWDNTLRSTIAGSLQLEVRVALRYDREPVPNAEKLDTVTQLNLIYTLVSDEAGGEPG